MDETPRLGEESFESAAAAKQKVNINLNITTQIDLQRRESVLSSASVEATSETPGGEGEAKVKVEGENEFDPDAIIQEATEATEAIVKETKPRLQGRNFTAMPPIKREGDLSSLCSIM